MKNKWLSFFEGKVQLEVTGRGIERLLNECTRRGIPIFHLKKRKKPSCYIYSFRMYMPFGVSGENLTVKPVLSIEKGSRSYC